MILNADGAGTTTALLEKIQKISLLVAPLIAMEANHIRYMGGGGGSSVIPAEVTSLAALEAAKATHHASPIMRLSALATAAPTLLASRS